MRIALMQVDSRTLDLVRGLIADPTHSFELAFEPGPFRGPLEQLGIRCVDAGWEKVVSQSDMDAIVFGRGGTDELRQQQLRLIVQSEIPLIAVHPVGGMLLGFELQMIQKETNGLICPFSPELLDPLWSGFRAGPSADSENTIPGRLGEVTHVSIQRVATATDRRTVEAIFAEDALLLRQIVGRIVRVNAMHPGGIESEDWANLNVQMTNERSGIAVWTVTRGRVDRRDWVLTGTSGILELPWSDGVPVGRWRNEAEDHRALGHLSPGPKELGIRLLNLCHEARDSDSPARQRVDRMWDDACRAVEIADTVDLSAKKGKTLELFHEEHSEESTFKGVMAAGGCFLLLAILALIPLLVFLEGLIPGLAELSFWRRLPWIALSLLLVAFLGMQLLRLLTRVRP